MTDQPGPAPGVEPPASSSPILFLPDEPATQPGRRDPGELMLTCANCGAPMDERKCKLICTCGYFLSCSDYL